jgi:hypothetical protein
MIKRCNREFSLNFREFYDAIIIYRIHAYRKVFIRFYRRNRTNNNQSLTHSLCHLQSLLAFCRYTMLSMRKKIRFLSFYLLNTHENEFSFAWMTRYNGRTSKAIGRDLMSDCYFFGS